MATDTFLEICQEVFQKLGMQGSFNTVSVNTTDYRYKIVDAVSSSWRDLQLSRKELYCKKKGKSFTLTAGETLYYPYNSGSGNEIFTATEYERFGQWLPGEFSIPDTATGTVTTGTNYSLTYVPWPEFRTYDISTAKPTPTTFSIYDLDSAGGSVKQGETLLFHPTTVNWPIYAVYYQAPQILSANTDEPDLNHRLRPVIMWMALERAAIFFGNADMAALASREYDKLLGTFYRDNVPQKRINTPSIV